MPGSHPDQDDFRMDRGAGKTPGPGGRGGRGSDIDSSYEDATAILGRPWQAPPPYVQYVVTMQDAEGAALAQKLTLLRRLAGLGVVFSQPSPLGDAVEAFIRALRETAPTDRAMNDPPTAPTLPDPAVVAHLCDLRAAIEQLAPEAAVRQALDEVCAFPAIAGRM
ncbi:MAG: hypothetical protein HZB53_11605 [Chloroflexi bacterium]|nr:hypothetical protein [Chloroflexota bacterium]